MERGRGREGECSTTDEDFSLWKPHGTTPSCAGVTQPNAAAAESARHATRVIGILEARQLMSDGRAWRAFLR